MSALLDICEAIDGPNPEWYREAADEFAPPRDTESPEMSYEYRGNGRSLRPEEAERRLTSRPQLATSAQARAAAPAPTVVPGTVVRDLSPAPQIKGAVKVDAFPVKSKYPFRQIADDGGVWKLDPAAFEVTHHAIRLAAPKWAKANGLKAKLALEDGQVYIQFTRAQP